MTSNIHEIQRCYEFLLAGFLLMHAIIVLKNEARSVEITIQGHSV